MNQTLLKLYVKFQELKSSEQGQDLIEYGLLVSMVALAAISGEKGVASAVTHMFTNISSSVA
jgi:pilus assembly protein Flp/PilA